MDDNLQRRYLAAVDLAASVWPEETEWDSVLAVLRSNGFDMSLSHKATITVLGVDAPTASQLVVDSPVWADQRQAYVEANEAFSEAVRETADEWHEDESGWRATINLRRRRWWRRRSR